MTPDDIEGLELPAALPERYHLAARSAIGAVFANPAPVRAVTLGGSIVRGEGDPLSDLDIWVVVDGRARQRVQMRFDGVPCELFFNPEDRIRRYFDEEAATGSASSIGLTLDGEVLFDPEGVAARLRAEAAAVWRAGPKVPEDAVRYRVYGAVDGLDNARDVEPRDPLMATLLTAEAVKEAMVLAYLLAGSWVPRAKDLRSGLGRVRPGAEAPVADYGRRPGVGTAAAVLDAILGVSTFFDWETTPSED